jgi:acetate kinase
MTEILTLNAGSSSLRAHIVDGDRVLADYGTESPVGSEEARAVLSEVMERASQVDAVGHRLVHGGSRLTEPTVVDDQALAAAESAAALAPLHVPPALELVRNVRERLPNVPQVLCPDTAFHAGMPEVSRTLPLPSAWRRRFGLRRYGFHGLSYAWAIRRTASLLNRPLGQLQILLAHLGGGGSVCAVRDGSSVDTSMSFTPLDGIPMTTRSGAVDPGLLIWLLEEQKLSVDELAEGLQRKSGLQGMSDDLSADTRVLVRAADNGNAAARLALDVYSQRVAQALAAMATCLDRVDAVVFTGEIGWDQHEVRTAICARLGILGVEGSLSGNRDDDGPVSAPDAAVPVLIVRTREELQIAGETAATLRLVREPHLTDEDS